MNIKITKMSKSFLAILLAVSVAGCSSATPAADTQADESAISTDVIQTPQAQTYVGVLQAESQTPVIPLATGQILQCAVSVGDQVAQGDLLYQIDDNGLSDSIASTQNSIAKANISVQLANENLADLKIYAPCDGILQDFTVQQGQRVSATQIGTVVDESVLVATVPFNAQQAAQIQVGDAATLVSSQHMTSLSGKVTMIYDATVAREDGSVLRNVEIEATNPGGFASGSTVGAQVQTAGGAISCALSGTAICGKSSLLVSRGSGYAKTVFIKNGKQVKTGELILELENDTLTATARRAVLDRDDLMIKLNSLQADYADCFLYAPASGTVIEKSKDTLDSITSERESIMTLADIRQLTMSLMVEEKDISSFPPGGALSITTDNAEYPQLSGIITDVGTQEQINNGVLFYPVTITIDNPDALLPGIQATVTIS